MVIDFPIEETIRIRHSVRNYSDEAIDADKIKAIERFVDSMDNPFGKEILFHYLDTDGLADRQKLGTYGIIRGAKHFIGASIKREPMTLEALGYELETIILYLAYLGIDSCWLGGTFNRKGFSKAMDIADDALFPVITPYGYGAQRMHLTEILMRKMIRADHRKPWEQLFFSEDFLSPLTKQSAGDLAFPLEMLRLGPSASNKQPWRILFKGGACHFYEYKEPRYSDAFHYDIQRIDMGIAAAHFDLSTKEKGIRGHFDLTGGPVTELPDHFEYVYSWLRM